LITLKLRILAATFGPERTNIRFISGPRSLPVFVCCPVKFEVSRMSGQNLRCRVCPGKIWGVAYVRAKF